MTQLSDVIAELQAQCGDDNEENGDETAGGIFLRGFLTYCIPAASVSYALPLLPLLRIPNTDAVILAELAQLGATLEALVTTPPK
jgi:hypothetical protein